MKTFFVFFILISVSLTQLKAQTSAEWKIYSDKKEVNSAMITGSDLWAAAGGGVFRHTFTDSSYLLLTKAEGLNGSPINSLTIDKYGKIWFGSVNGIIDVYDPATAKTTAILDIFNSGRSSKAVINLQAKGDTVIAATEFGISLININDLNFYDSYLKLGSFSVNTKINAVLFDTVVFAATPAGIAVQKKGSDNLTAPESWYNFNTAQGLPSNIVYSIVNYKGNIIAATERGLAKYENGAWVSYLPGLRNQVINTMTVDGEKLIISVKNTLQTVNPYGIYFTKDGAVTDSILNLPTITSIAGRFNDKYYVASSLGMIIMNTGFVEAILYPEGPGANLFADIKSTKDGSLWIGSGTDVAGKGIYNFTGEKWKTYDVSNIPGLPTNGYNNIHISGSNVYAGSYGRGFLRIKPGSQYDIFTAANTPIKGISADTNYLIIPSIKSDSKGNVWLLNYEAADRKILFALDKSDHFYGFENRQNQFVSVYRELEVDLSDTKWFFAQSRTDVFYFNEKGTLTTTTDDVFGVINESTGLNGQRINTIKIDKRGDLWIGTDLGINIVSGLSSVLNTGGSTKPRVSSVFSVRQQKINAIVVDAINRKWVGTDQGLILLSSDGSNLIAAYDSKNSPLLSDEVKTLGIDEENGIVYIGQSGGLIALKTDAQAPERDYSNLRVYPSPYKINGSGKPLTIDGLIKDSEIMILNLAGDLIRTLSTPGGRVATWDGRDTSGNPVSSGVYYLIAHDAEGNIIGKTKFVVIKE